MSKIQNVKKLLRSKEINVRDLVQESLLKINKGSHNRLNCFITLEDMHTLDSAIKHSQDRYNNGTERRLEGIPIALKDNYTTKGIKTTCASKMLKDYVPTFDSTVAKLLKDEGAIIIGKTNMDEFAMGSSSTSGYFGSVVNPWSEKSKEKKELVAGGSSGGSAACVAADYVLASIGSDTGGSIRQPAAYCGVVGFKPSYGTISRYGLISYASSLDTPGVFSKNVDDASLLLDILIKQDMDHDATSISSPFKSIDESYQNYKKNKSIKDLVFGIPMDYLVKELDQEILDLWKKVVDDIEAAGGKVVPVSLPHTKYALPSYYLLATSEASSNLARFDGIRFGHRASSSTNQADEGWGQGLKQMYKDNRTEGFGEEVKKRILLGTMALSRGSIDNYYSKAQKIRRLISQDFKSVFKGTNTPQDPTQIKVDVIITPTSPTGAFEIDSHLDPINMYINDIMTIPSNMAGVPSVSIPLKLSKKNNTPLGLQLISKRLNDDLLLFASDLVMNLSADKEFK
ncbi:hypothetical protein CYY_003032 [Polysphondylium violaceum]|uniref:Glutamyl-tRNA(Gln) amidotransferase subunit A, mitochondrial n=1 Tax=Polysphondylium violaceum TaxID=133409 RepID=A0A8J4V929_9MYCE|nr:hypothetical protein CYY_003032 [Polysphondylium violaceum]